MAVPQEDARSVNLARELCGLASRRGRRGVRRAYDHCDRCGVSTTNASGAPYNFEKCAGQPVQSCFRKYALRRSRIPFLIRRAAWGVLKGAGQHQVRRLPRAGGGPALPQGAARGRRRQPRLRGLAPGGPRARPHRTKSAHFCAAAHPLHARSAIILGARPVPRFLRWRRGRTAGGSVPARPGRGGDVAALPPGDGALHAARRARDHRPSRPSRGWSCHFDAPHNICFVLIHEKLYNRGSLDDSTAHG